MTAFPDLKFEVKQVTVNGDQATVNTMWSGRNSAAIEPAHAWDAGDTGNREDSIGEGYLYRHSAR